MSAVLGQEEFRRAILAAAAALHARRDEIDRANVYPVPDGDTGTNLSLTFAAVADAVGAAPHDDAAVRDAVASGALYGARGNSGVIMSQFLRGLSESLRADADGAVVAAALLRAADAAYEAVLEPVEGTILTVAREAAAGAAVVAGRGVHAVLDAAATSAREALARTPDLLPALRAAGVVDAGGMGLCVVLEAFRDSFAGRSAAPVSDVPGRPGLDSAPRTPVPRALARPDGAAGEHETGTSRYEYEVQYLLAAPDAAAAALRARLSEIGDSVGVVGGNSLWRVHVHTSDVGAAIEAGVEAGRPSSIEVVAFRDQIGAQPSERDRHGRGLVAVAGGQHGITLARADTRSALVVVASGGGATALFRELGAETVVETPGMSPSVGELLEAVEAASADRVIVLTNAKDAEAAARRVATLASRRTEVVAAPDMAAGLAAAVAYGDARDADENLRDMRAALAGVRTGRVAVATRDAGTPAGDVRDGDALGFVGDGVVSVARDPIASATAVADALLEAPAETLTVLAGADAPAEERARLREGLAARFPDVAVEVFDGGQPVHRYLLSVE